MAGKPKIKMGNEDNPEEYIQVQKQVKRGKTSKTRKTINSIKDWQVSLNR